MATAVVEFFTIVGQQDVPEEKVPARLIEVATHFARTRDELAALEPEDPHVAALTRSAKSALDAGRFNEADSLADQAKEARACGLPPSTRTKGKSPRS
jgi:hypothetical protein